MLAGGVGAAALVALPDLAFAGSASAVTTAAKGAIAVGQGPAHFFVYGMPGSKGGSSALQGAVGRRLARWPGTRPLPLPRSSPPLR